MHSLQIQHLARIPACTLGLFLAAGGLGCGRPANSPDTCVPDGGPPHMDAARELSLPPSCAGLPETCGPNENENCCTTIFVPGGTFNRSNDERYAATVSDFWLDKYEVTLDRVKAFLGVSWSPRDWTECGLGPTGGPRGNRPVACLYWHEAVGFCAWDGGRLPTEAEWNYAAAGGSEQRRYPWSNPPSNRTIDDTYAVYCGGSCDGTQRVGSKSPKGDGRWGHADLAGNAWEWTFDGLFGGNNPPPYYDVPCNDCALRQGDMHIVRGGGYRSGALSLDTGNRAFGETWDDGLIWWGHAGVRCARNAQ